MMKSYISKGILLAIAMLSFITVNAYEFTDNGLNFRWQLGDEVYLCGLNKLSDDGKLVVPEVAYDYGELQYVTGISDMRYGNNLDLVRSIVINNNVDEIEPWALCGCNNLTKLEYNITNCGRFANVRFTDEGSPFPNTISEVIIGDNVDVIPKAFLNGDDALQEVKIPNNVTVIGSYAFKNCSNLTKVTLGERVSHIGRECFAGSYNIQTITSYTLTPPELDEETIFDNIAYENCILFVPPTKLADYKAASVWKNFLHIYAIGDTLIEVIKLNNYEVPMNIGETIRLIASTEPLEVSNPEIIWTSDNPEIARVDSDGTVTAVSIGTVNIIARYGALSAVCKVTVNPVVALSITLDINEMALLLGETKQLTANIYPDNTTDKSISWISGNTAVATVDANGVVTGVAKGSTAIIAMSGTLTATCVVTVEDPTIAAKALEFEGIIGNVGEMVAIGAKVLPANVTDPTISWQSSNPEVAAVDQEGSVWFNAAGSATVTAECQGHELSPPFVVREVMARALNVFPVEAVGGVGHEFSLLALHEPENTTDKSVTWESSDPEVATVSEDGRVSLASLGSAKITARSGEHTAVCAVTVDETVGLTEMASTGVVIDVVEGGIVVRNVDAGESIAVYSVDGKVVNGAIAEGEETKLSLAAGIYIVKVSPATVAKVLVK